MENLTEDNAQQLFIEQYKSDTPEMRKWLENTVREKFLAQYERGELTEEEFKQGKKDIDGLIRQARAAVEGVKIDA